MSTRIVIVSQLYDAAADAWDEPTELCDFGPDDEGLAKAWARGEATRRLAELIARDKRNAREEYSWLERISVCPRVSGIGRGGGDYIALGDCSLRLTIGLE